MKSLYHKEYFSYTKDARELDSEIRTAIKPILKKYFDMGYSPREISSIAKDTIGIAEAEIIVFYVTKKLKKEEEENEK